MASKTEQAPTISAEEKAEARRAQQREQKKRKRAEEKAAKSATEALMENEQNGVGHGRSPSEAAREDAARSREREQAQQQPQQAQSSTRRQKYDAELVEATEIAVKLRGKKGGAGPKQHAHVRQVITNMIGGEVTSARLAEIAGFESMDEIRDYVQGNNEPGTTRAIRQRFVPLDEKMGDDWYTHGMMLASILAAWAVQLDR